MFLLLGIIVSLLILLFFRELEFNKFKFKSEEQKKKEVQFAREDSVKKSRSTINGAIVENLAPIIPGFNYNGRDATHVGSPIDFIIFNGMSNFRDNSIGEIEIVIIDVKTGAAQLTPVEKAIQDACENGRVRFETLRFDENRGGLIPVKRRKKKENTIDELTDLEYNPSHEEKLDNQESFS